MNSISKKDLELFLYKNNYNDKTIIDFLPKLSAKSIYYLSRDLGYPISCEDKSNKMYIFSDGGCKSNGKKTSKAGYSVFFTDDTNSKFYQFNTTQIISEDPTNNKAELLAILKIFQIIYDNTNLFEKLDIYICTDSMYSINCVEKWSRNWLKNNWKNAKGENVKNQNIIKEILEKRNYLNNCDNIKISFHHIFSHLQEPTDKNSLEYKLWYGNKKVDDNINALF